MKFRTIGLGLRYTYTAHSLIDLHRVQPVQVHWLNHQVKQVIRCLHACMNEIVWYCQWEMCVWPKITHRFPVVVQVIYCPILSSRVECHFSRPQLGFLPPSRVSMDIKQDVNRQKVSSFFPHVPFKNLLMVTLKTCFWFVQFPWHMVYSQNPLIMSLFMKWMDHIRRYPAKVKIYCIILNGIK